MTQTHLTDKGVREGVKWWGACVVTVKGKREMAGGSFFPTRTIAEIEVDRMVRRQPPHLFPEPFIAPHEIGDSK